VQPESVQPEARQPAPVQAKTVPPEAGQPALVQAKTVPPEPVQPDPEPIPEPIVETPVVQVAKAAPPARKPAEPKRPAPPPPAEKPAPIEAQMSSETLNTQPDEVLIINILSRDKNGFNGADLLEVLLACDVRFGSMDIFHRYEGAQGKGRIQFSVANLVKPGTFDLDNIKEFYTPGVCMFLQLPGPKEPLAAFDCMAEIANCIVKNLQGEMRDEAHSVLTGQTIEHYRERIRDYERKRLMRAAHRSA
jgi:cell division protein ZipA